MFAAEQSGNFDARNRCSAQSRVSPGLVEFNTGAVSRSRFKNELQKFAASETIYSAGDPSNGMYGLVSGGVRLSIAPKDQEPLTLHFFVPGTWMGDSGAMSGRPRIVTLTTTKETQVLYLSPVSISTILREDPDAYRSFAYLGQLNMATALVAIGDLLLKDPGHRVMSLLLRLSGCRSETPKSIGVVDIDLGQDELAQMCNVGRTTTNTVLNDLESAGLIEVAYRRIRVLRPDELRARIAA